MFNKQLDFGLNIEFESQQYKTNQWAVKILRQSRKEFLPLVPFMELEKNDIFMAIDKDSGERVTHEDGSDLFKAISNPYRDELGIPCIDITTKISKSELQ